MTRNQFLKSMLALAAVLLAIFLIILLWLRSYTNHGQKLELPDFVGMAYDKAHELGEDRSFELIVNDSIHIVGRKGGEIVNQNPIAFSKVKEDRKVYVTLTKFNADVIKAASLGVMYGQEFKSKQAELNNLSINSEILNYKYDPGEPDHILEVWYEGVPIITGSGRKNDVEIKKGGTLQFVLSKRQGGSIPVPNLMCNTYGATKFILESSNLELGTITEDGIIGDRTSAYVISQIPSYLAGETMSMGQTIDITISQTKPANCQ